MRTLIAITAAILVAGAAPVFADGKTWFSLHGGYAMPEGPFKDRGKNGIAVEADLHRMLLPSLGIGASYGYADFQASSDLNAAVETLYGPGSTLVFTHFTYTGYAIVALPLGRITPYARGGAGVFNPKLQIRSGYGIADQTRREWGYMAGGGINVMMTQRLGFGVDGTWQGYDDGFLDLKMSWVNAKATFTYALPGWNDALRP